MDFDRSEIQQMLVDSAERLMNAHSGLEYWRKRRELPDGCDRELWSTFAELGWIALPLPEDVGGLGGSLEDVALLMIEFGRGLANDPIVSTAVLAAHLVDQGLSGELRTEVLEAVATGALRIALAHDEAADRYELGDARATAARREGDEFVLDGAKMLVLDGPSADRLLVTASFDGEPGFGIFLVDAHAQGVTSSHYPLIDGSRAADVEFNAVRIPAEHLLAAGARARDLLAEAVERANIALMAQAVGSMEASVAISADYAKQRRQFGQPIGKFQAIQHLASDMFVAAFQARSALYQALAAADAEAPARMRAVSLARVVVGESGQVVGRNGIQIHGGYGVTDEFAISHHYRRLLSLEKQFGDIEHHASRLAAMMDANVTP